MPAYLTAAEIMAATSAKELAQVAAPRDMPPPTAETMRKAIEGEDISGAPDRDRALAALERIDEIASNATDLVDNFLRTRYPVPLATPPSTIREIMVRVVRYLLHDARPTEEITARYKEALAWLREIQAGTQTLDVPGVVVDTYAPQYAGNRPIYTMENLEPFARGWP